MPALTQGSAGNKSTTMTHETTHETTTLSQELDTMPIVDSMWGLISNAKNTPVVGVGLQIAGWSYGVVAHQVNTCCADKVKAVDEFVGGYMVAFKDHYPILREPTSDVVEHVVDNASRMARTSARTVIQSYPGQTIMECLDGVISASSYVLKKVQTSTKSRKRSSRSKPTRFSSNAENAKSDSKGKTAEASKSTQTPKKDGDDQKCLTPGILKKLQPAESRAKTLVEYAYQLVIVTPVKFTIKSLIRIRSLLHKFDGNKRKSSQSTGMSPENAREIESRRKISPRKRITNTFFGRVRTTAKQFLGLGSKAISLTQADIRSYFNCDRSPNSVNGEDAERKRKYDDIQTDPDSEDSLVDLENYRSEEDSDYTSPSANSTDSMEYQAGDTESDISIDSELIQIKDRKTDPPVSENKPATKNKPNQSTEQKVNGTDSKSTTPGNKELKSSDKANTQPGKPAESKTTTSGKPTTPKTTSSGSDKGKPADKSGKENIPAKSGTAS